MMICPICKSAEFRLVHFKKQRSFTDRRSHGRFECQDAECGHVEII